jgi:hypothetical protein
MKIRDIARTSAAAVLILGTVAASEACAASRSRLYVRVGPPTSIVEARIASPGPGHVWVPGFHRWDGGRYVWVAGSWQRPPRGLATWVPGHWAHNRSGWYWVEGRWR